MHDASLLGDARLRQSVATATRLAEAHAALRREVSAKAEAVANSRRRLQLAADEARATLAEQLDLSVGQRLAALDAALREAGDATPAVARERLRQLRIELEELSSGLYPSSLANGLSSALTELAARTPVPVELVLDIPPTVSTEAEVTAYYVVSETLTNVAKHAGPTSATVTVQNQAGDLLVKVADDGAGGAATTTGSGLGGLADRVAAAGGRLTIDSPLGSGTRISAWVPLGSGETPVDRDTALA